MSDRCDPVGETARLLVGQAGGYLRNVIREPFVTCVTCTTPVDGYERCYRCQHDRCAGVAADVVAPLVYGIERRQSGMVLRHYKDDPSAQARRQHARVLRRLLYLGITRHQACIETLVGQPVSARVAVPSLNRRPGVHPFVALAAAMKATGEDLTLSPAAGATGERLASATQFEVTSARGLTGQHILVLDDTWTTGSRAQSAALALRAAGAGHVSVMVIGRWLSPGFGRNAEFVSTRLRREYDPGICPVTGGACP
ncbi:amidophosphoribosyltransferase [Mycobacterium simiae]|uniref:Amidophosphoribosyltransferase n=1 Tax=Mycobacterium simiae TaxID=1784 RepID=A0A5B1BRU0_MYCSI|nr:amidophosphoribosyltransferase [Mycobacterium simiae]KAA1250751.1 amidophosphoribosyltransferase [Mycobacterium simiae]